MTESLARPPFVLALAALARPRQWLKNVFVLAPLVFAERFREPDALIRAGLAFVCFCLIASAFYAINDVLDCDADRRHPRKKSRPVAAGLISPPAALAFAASLAAAAIAIAFFTLPPGVLAALAAYAANALAYALLLKYRVIADVLCIAFGFVIRLLAGCAAVAVEPSSWLVVCGFALAMVLGFGKRRAEVEAPDVGPAFRFTLLSYSRSKLDAVLAVCTAVCLVAYMLYTVAPDTVARHGTDKLVYTVPIVAYGLFRYLFKAQEGTGDGPSEILAADPIFALTGLAWGAAVLAILVWK